MLLTASTERWTSTKQSSSGSRRVRHASRSSPIRATASSLSACIYPTEFQRMITLRIISLALFLALEASGQTQTTGGISGTIQDSLNDYVAGARVTVTRISTHEQRTIATGE